MVGVETSTPLLGLVDLIDGAGGGAANHNAAIRTLERLGTAPRVIDRDLTAPPGSESNGDLYIVAASATGSWSGQDGKFAYYNNGYSYHSIRNGQVVLIDDESDAVYVQAGGNLELVWGRGAAFPTSPREGWKFYRTDLEAEFYYDSSRSKWLGEIIVVHGWSNANVTAYFKHGDAGTLTMSASIGVIAPWSCICVGLLLKNASSTVTVEARDDGTGVTGASMSLSAETFKKDMTLNSSTIAANSVISLAVSSGTSAASTICMGHFRRVET